MALPLVEPTAFATLRAAATALAEPQGQQFGAAIVGAVDAVWGELQEIHARNEATHAEIQHRLGEVGQATAGHAANFTTLEQLLQALRGFVGRTAESSDAAAMTLAERVLADGNWARDKQARLYACDRAGGLALRFEMCAPSMVTRRGVSRLALV